MALNKKILSTRAVSALFFVIILIGAICYSYYSFLILFFVISLIALREYYKLAALLNTRPYRLTGFSVAILLFIRASVPNFWDHFPENEILHMICSVLVILFPFILLIIALFNKGTSNLTDVLHTLFGIIYAVFPLTLLISIPVHVVNGEFTYTYFKVLGILFLIWSNDTLAYLGGSLFGKTKLFERISPGKTWEGTAIGALGAIGIGFVLNLNHTYPYDFIWPLIGGLVAIFGTLGDLVESLLKRQAGVKDSGQLIPGHGGALDRFDSLLFVTPFIYGLLKMLGLL